MNTKLLAGLIPALSLSMGSLCNMMAEGVPDGAAGGGTAPPAQPSAAGMMPIIPPAAPPVAPPPVAPPVAPPAAAPPAAAPQYVTHEMFAESEKRMRETIQDTLKALLSGGAQLQAQPQAPPVAASTPPAAPTAPPVPPQPPAAPPPAPAPQQQLDPALLAFRQEHEQLKQRQAESDKLLQQMKAEKEAAEEKAALMDTTLAVRTALEKNSKYKLTPEAVTAAAEVLMLKGVVNRSKENKRLYLELGIDQASGQKKFELLETGIETWLDTPDAKIYKQVVPPGMGFQGSAAGGVPMSFPQGVNPARGNHLGQVEYTTAAQKALLPS